MARPKSITPSRFKDVLCEYGRAFVKRRGVTHDKDNARRDEFAWVCKILLGMSGASIAAKVRAKTGASYDYAARRASRALDRNRKEELKMKWGSR